MVGCTYSLKLSKILENPNNDVLPEELIVTVEIIDTTENSYSQRVTSNLSKLILENEVFIVE